MLRMSNVSRHRPQDTLEWFYDEWHGKHVDIMRDAPGVMRLVRRYVQNRALHDNSLPEPFLPLGAQGWDAMSQLTFNDTACFIESFEDPDYIEKVRSHQLSDPTVIVSMLTEAEFISGSRQATDAVKMIQFYRTSEGVGPSDLSNALKDFEAISAASPGFQRYVRNWPAANVSPEVFIGSRWEGIPFNLYAAFDEIYFSDRSELAAFLTNETAQSAMASVRVKALHPESFTYLCREIVQINSLEENDEY